MIEIEWDDKKNKTNIERHCLDFSDAWLVFEAPMLTRIDTRKEYGEVRWVTLGQLVTAVVVIVYTKRNNKIRIISLRRANRNERKIYWEKFKQH